MNPFVISAAFTIWLAAIIGAFVYGQGVGVDGEIAKQAGISQAITDTREAAQQGAAAAIAKIKPQNVTIRQETEREIHTNTIYATCRVPADGLRIANQAITGAPAQPTGGGQLPTANAPK